jgi:glycosyltransferase involved in cell wall biosynthesis
MGHGHYAQFLNFQESLAAESADRAEWISLDGERSGDWMGGLPFVPWRIRYSRNQIWHANRGIARHDDWDAIFLACRQVGLLPLIRRFPTFYYADMSPSLEASLAPWYDQKKPIVSFRGRLRDMLVEKFHTSLTGLFTMSEWARQGFHRDYKIPLEKIHVSLPGANLKRFRFVDRSGRAPGGPVRILMVGSEFRRKGGELLLEWAEETRLRGWELDIVTWPGGLPAWVRDCLGNPAPDATLTKSLAPRRPNVTVHCGVRANTPEAMRLYADADIFCLPTQADGSSIASLEAMATGLPVLAGAVGGIPELIRDGETGFLVRRSDAEDLACKLERLIGDRDLRLAVGAAGRRSCEGYFNVTRQLSEIFEVVDRDRAARAT